MNEQDFIKYKTIFMHSVEQAIAYGMTGYEGCHGEDFDVFVKFLRSTVPLQNEMTLIDNMIAKGGYLTVLFSDEFCQAFFPPGKVEEAGHAIFTNEKGETAFERDYGYTMPYWQWHKKTMSCHPQPLLYLEPYLLSLPEKQEWK